MTRPEEAFSRARDDAAAAAAGWALDEAGHDRLAFDGIPVAEALRVEAFGVLLPIALDAAGVSSELRHRGTTGWLKRQGLDRLVRSVATAVAASRVGARRPNGGRGRPLDALFVIEAASPSMVESAAAVAARLGPDRALVAVAHPGAVGPLTAAGIPIQALVPTTAGLRPGLRRAASALNERWEAIRRRPARIVMGGRDVTGAALAALAPLARRSAPWLAVERDALRAMVGDTRPRWVVVASDQHRLGRLAVAEAGPGGARSLVLQHGMPQFDLGYVPVRADLVAAWSRSAVDWFRARGTPPEHLEVLGNPRLDAAIAVPRPEARSSVDARHRIGGSPRVLMALSPGDRDGNARLLAAGASVLSAVPEGAVIVKLHPGDGDWRSAEATVGGWPSGRAAVAHREPLGPLLRWADAVVVHRSTVALEALAAGTPVVLDTAPAETADETLADLELAWFADPSSLAEVIGSVAGDDAREAFFMARSDRLDRALGPRDGLVAERVAARLRGSG